MKAFKNRFNILTHFYYFPDQRKHLCFIFRNIVKEFQDKCRCCPDQDLLPRWIVNSSQDKTSLIGKTSSITDNSQKLGRACIVSVLHQKQQLLKLRAQKAKFASTNSISEKSQNETSLHRWCHRSCHTSPCCSTIRRLFSSSSNHHLIILYYFHTFELILSKGNVYLKRLFFIILPPPPGNFLTCTICEAVMTAIDQSIVDPTNEQVAFMIIIIF